MYYNVAQRSAVRCYLLVILSEKRNDESKDPYILGRLYQLYYEPARS